MKYLLFALLMAFSLSAIAQQNVLLDRNFWRSNPDVVTLKQKIAEGNDPVAMNSNAFDPTVYAILEKAPLASIQYLLDLEGNEASKMTHDGRNYLIWAAYSGNEKLVEDLIERGSDINLKDDHGNSAVTFCANGGKMNTQVYDALIKGGADINATNREGANALLLIAPHISDDYSIIEYFTKNGLALNSTDDHANGLFNYAARKGDLAFLDQIIKWGLPYKEKNELGGNAVIFASRGSRGHSNALEVYTYLEQKGLDMAVVNSEGITPLHAIAGRVKDIAIFNYFIEKGVDINQADKDGNTLLLNAVNGRNEVVVEHFLSKVNDINHQNKDGHSALTLALRRGLKASFKALLKGGADIYVVDKEGSSLAGHLFQTFNPKGKEVFENLLSTLKAKHVSLTAPQAKANTLLHIAVDRQQAYLIHKAVELGVDLNAKNEDGLTALHLAVMKAKDTKLIKLLLEKGADKDIKTDFEETVYELAAENELLNKGAFDLDLLKK